MATVVLLLGLLFIAYVLAIVADSTLSALEDRNRRWAAHADASPHDSTSRAADGYERVEGERDDDLVAGARRSA
jgi:hypothetical protein